MILLSALLGIGPTEYYYISAALLLTFAAVMIFSKESRRKFFVALKRKPQNIPLVMVIMCFVWYSLNLSVISFTTTRIHSETGLMGFVIMLFSLLAIVCCMRAFPYRKKTVVLMLVLNFVMLAIVLTSDILYLRTIAAKIQEGLIESSALTKVYQARSILIAHVAMLGITILLTATLPIYRKWIRKINTSIEVEESGKMEAIDISGE